MLLYPTSKSQGLYNLPTDNLPIHADTGQSHILRTVFLAISKKMFRKTSATSISSLFDGDLPPRSTATSPVPAAVGLSDPQMSGHQRHMLDRINELHTTG